MTQTKRILVLCTGNSCRSILAECLINHLGKGRFQADSAGSHPVGWVHPMAIATLDQHGLATAGLRSKSWSEFLSDDIDLVLTVCDAAAAEVCPIFPGQPAKLHWSIPDPAKATGTDAEVRQAFEAVFQQLKQRIELEILSNQAS